MDRATHSDIDATQSNQLGAPSAAPASTLPKNGRRSRPWALWARWTGAASAVRHRGVDPLVERMLTAMAQTMVLVGMVLALVWPAPVGRTLLPGGSFMSDLVISHWSSAELIKQTVADEQRLPLWNPVYGGGRPLAADPLAALFYPPTHLVHVFGVRDHLLLLLVGHLLWAGLGTLVLAQRVLRLSPSAALVAALTFMATPRLIAHLGAGHLTMIQTVSWFPWVAVGCWATVRNPRRWSVPFAACLALMLLAGHPQLAYYGGLMVAGQSLWLLGIRWRHHGVRALPAPMAGLAFAAGLAVMLAAVHLLPLMEFTAHSTRQRSVASRDAMSLWAFLAALVGFRAESEVPHEGMFEPGLAVLVLAVLGVAAGGRRTALPLLLGITIVATLALGVSSPVYRVAAQVLPGLDGFRGLARIWFVALLGIALLAGRGAQMLLHGIWRSARWDLATAGVVGGLLLVISLLQTDRSFINLQPVKDVAVPSRLERAAAAVAQTGRIYGVQRNLRQAAMTVLGARMADGWDPLLIEPYVTFMQRAGGYTFEGYQLSVPPYEVYDAGYPTSRNAQPDATLLGLLDIEAVVSRTQLTDRRLTQVAKVGKTFIYRNTANAGPAYLVAPGANGALPTIDRLRQLDANVQIVEHHAERLKVRVTAERDGWLSLGTPAFPGWVALLDGAPATLATIEGVVPAVWLPAGTHEVTYAYAPRSVQLGGAVSAAGVLLGGGWLLGAWIAQRRSTQRSITETKKRS